MTLSRRWDRGLTLYLPLGLYLAFTLLPFYSILMLAFHKGGQTTGAFSYVPVPFTLDHFKTLFEVDSFLPYVRNSAIVSFGAVLVDVPLAVLTGYALSRFKFRGKSSFMLALLATQFVPTSMLIIPMYIIFKDLHLLNSLWGLVLLNSTFEIPLAAILMRSFVDTVPIELEEAAMIDGCTRRQGVVRVVLPLLSPGMVAVGAFAFVGAWNNYLFALFLISDQDKYTVPVGLSYFLGEFNVDLAALAAGATVAVIPVIAVFAVLQRYLTGGLAGGAVKG
jgi:multiple sugar transport system permease protein